MKTPPVLVEVNVERKGIFVVTTSILMCSDYTQAVQTFADQSQLADALLEAQESAEVLGFARYLWERTYGRASKE